MSGARAGLDHQRSDSAHVPYNIEVEQALLGALLLDNSRIDQVAALLEPEHFYDQLHQRIFEMTCYLVTEGSVSPLTLHAAIKTDPGLMEVGGLGYLAGLAEASPAMPNVSEYARIIRECGARRELIRIGEEMVNAAYEPPTEKSATEIAGEAAEDIVRIGADSNVKQTEGIGAVARIMVARMEASKKSNVRLRGVPLGLSPLDAVLGGLLAGDLMIVAGRPGMGKSALLGGVARAAAEDQTPTLVFSAEMTKIQWTQRSICDVDFDLFERDGMTRPLQYQRFRIDDFTDREFERIILASRALDALPLEICDASGMTITELTARARAFRMKHRRKHVRIVVDYLQIIEPGKGARERTREQEVSQVARGLKRLAKDLDCDVIAGCQLKNKGEKNAEKPPTPDDIRESGAIEMEADIIVSPYRQAYFVRQREPMLRNSPEWQTWLAELKTCQHDLRLLGFKQRHGDPSALNVDLYCDMGANAIRAQAPGGPADRAAADLLAGLSR